MALVRKYKGAGPIDKSKKVLTYENVGTYDAESLAAALTADLEEYANSLKLTGLNREDFLKYGAAMINAIKDGNVTKNANGTYTINGNYGLNNTYSDLDVAKKRSEGEVSWGAKPYLGDFLESHGIFTTLGTEDFRNRNHTLGLVGQWLNRNLRASKPTTTPTSTPFSITLYLADKLYRGDANLKQEWEALYPNQLDKFNLIALQLKDLTDEDYDNWANTDTALNNSATIKELVNKLRNGLENNNITEARDAAFRLGFTLKSIVNYDAKTDADDFNRLAIDALGVGASEQEIKDYEETLRLRDEATQRNIRAKALQDQIEDLWETFKESEKYNIHKFVNDNVINIPPFFNAQGLELYKGFVEDLNKIRESLIDNLPAEDSEAGRDLGEILDRIVDTYDYAQLQLSKNPSPKIKKQYDIILNDLFDKISYSENGKAAEEWILFRHLSTLKYSIIYNPKNHRLLRISNSLLGENNPYYTRLKDEFMVNHQALFHQEGGSLNSIYITSQGDTLDFSAFDETPETPDSTATNKDNTVPDGTPKKEEPKVSTPISEIDEYRLYAAIADIGSFIASLTAAGSVGSALIGTGATTLNLMADRMDENVSALRTGFNAGIGYAGDILSIIPYIGALRKAKKITNSLNTIATVGTGLLGAYGITNIGEHLNNIANLLSHPTDKKALADGLSSLSFFLNAFTTVRNLRRAKRDSEHFVLSDYKIKSQEGKEYEIPSDVYERIKNAHTYEQANAEFLNHVKDEHANLPYTKTTQDEKKLVINGVQNEVLPPFYTMERRGSEYTFTPAALDRGFVSWRIGDALAEYGGRVGKGAVRAYDWLSGYRNTGIPKGATSYSDDTFQLGNRTYTRGDDGKFHVDTEEVSKENIRRYKAKQKAIADHEKEVADRAAKRKQAAWDARKQKVKDAAKEKKLQFSDWLKTFVKSTEVETGKASEGGPKVTTPLTKIGEYYLKIPSNSPTFHWPESYIEGRYVLDEIKKFNNANGTNIPLDTWIGDPQLRFIFDANDGKVVLADKLGGILALTNNITELLKEGGILIPKDAKGRKITRNNKDMYGSEAFANWLKTIDNSIAIGAEDEEYDDSVWNWRRIKEDIDAILGINTLDTADDIAKANNEGPNRPTYDSKTGQLAAADREKSANYSEFTDFIANAISNGQVSPKILEYLNYLQQHYKGKHGKNINHFIDYIIDNVVNKDSATLYRNLRTDSDSSHSKYSMGPHHHITPKKDELVFYYKGKQLVNEGDIDITKATKYDAYDDDNHYTYYVANDDQATPDPGTGDGAPAGGTTSGGTTGGGTAGNLGTEQLTPARDNIYGDLDIGWRINWGNVNEIARTFMLNGQNRRAFEQKIKWDPALLGFIDRYGLQRGNQPVKDQAEYNDSRLGWIAGQTHSNDAALQLAGLTEATDRGGLGKLLAAGSDALEYWSSILRIQDLHNLDLEYNLNKADINRQSIAAKDKETADERAKLTIANATSLSNLMQGFSKQMFDRYANITEMLKQRQLLKEYNRRAAAARIFQAKIDNLSATDLSTYESELNRLQQQYLLDIGAYDDEDIRTMRKIIGRRILITPDLKLSARKGRKLSAGDHYILLDSRDFNKRKLAEVKEFYKNMRQNNKKHKS